MPANINVFFFRRGFVLKTTTGDLSEMGRGTEKKREFFSSFRMKGYCGFRFGFCFVLQWAS